MKRNSLLFFLLLNSILFAQTFDQNPAESAHFIYSELHVFPSDSLNDVYYTYRIPYNKMVFEKRGNKYAAGISVAVEVFDSKNKFVVRSFSSKELLTDNFDQTNAPHLYVEGMNLFSIGSGQFTIIPIFSDLKSGREIKLKPVHLSASQYPDSLMHPLVVDAAEINCGNGKLPSLSNFENNIPFASGEYNIIIPVSDTTNNEIYVNIISSKDTVYKADVKEYFDSGLSLESCSDRIALKKSGSAAKTRNFILRNFSRELDTGPIIINIFHKKEKKPFKVFQKAVVWYDKPSSLNDPENAIKELKYMEKDSVISELLSEKSENYQRALLNYWKRYDPTPATAFNELMSEYYERIDYAAINFAPIAGKSGADTDRGKVLIQFGKPQKVERASNEYGKIVETWVYENPQRKFIFVDQRGTGDFSLIKG